MQVYSPPIQDLRFVLHELLEVENLFASLPGFDGIDRELIDSVLVGAGSICAEQAFPANRTGDQQGCRFEDGKVTTPDGFKEAYDEFIKGGWFGLSFSDAYGGQNLPSTLGACVDEMLASANLSLSTFVVLTKGATLLLESHGDEDLKSIFLPKLVSGEWAGVMCLTEAHAGTDLGLMYTKAEPDHDSMYKVNGTKIFITGGEQDLTPNILHLVLAKLPDAPPGTKGISLFAVPKFLPNPDGSLGERNGVHCTSIEEKMGIHGSSTCTMQYENARGWLIGNPHEGLRCMFSMMNNVRIAVGQEGLAQGEIAYQSASAYAKERRQGRALTGPEDVEQPADPLLVHPDIRRLLLTTRALTEVSRALILWVWTLLDTARAHPDSAIRERASGLAALLTPVVKAFVTDSGFQSCVNAQQVFGGHGFIRETGIEQLVRDSRIAMIYEGANGVQALDLVARKLRSDRGKALEDLCLEIKTFIAENCENTQMDEFLAPLEKALIKLKEAGTYILTVAREDTNELGATSYAFLRFLGLVSGAYLFANSARISLRKRNGPEAEFYHAKLATVRFYFAHLLPETTTLSQVISAGADKLMTMEADSF